MTPYGLGGVGPEGVQSGPHHDCFERLVLHVSWLQVESPQVLGLAVGALEQGAQVISRSGHLRPDFVLYFGKRRSMEVPRYLYLKPIELVRLETRSTVCRFTRLERASAMPIICANNTRLVRDSPWTA